MFTIQINSWQHKEQKWFQVLLTLRKLGFDTNRIQKVEQGRWYIDKENNSFEVAEITQSWTAETIFHYFQFSKSGEDVMKQIRNQAGKDYYPQLRREVLNYFKKYEGENTTIIDNAALDLERHLAEKGFHYTNEFSPLHLWEIELQKN